MLARRFFASIVLALTAAVLTPSPASATTRYAAPRLVKIPGAAPCTNAAKPCTITVALASAGSGDEIVLSSGSYTKGNPILLDGADPFDEPLVVPNGAVMRGASSTNLPILNVRPNSQAEAGVQVGTNATIRDVEIRGTTTANNPIAYSLSVFNGLADRVRVRSTAAPGALLTSCSLASGTIRNSACLGTGTAAGGKVTAVSASVTTAVFALRNVTAITTVPDSEGIRTGTNNGTVTMNISNVIARGPAGDLSVRAGLAGGDTTANVDHSNWRTQNVSAAAGASAKLVQTGPNQNGATTTEPLFVNAAGGDYRQAAGSPTIDAGVIELSTGLVALGGMARTIGTTTDIGADEFDPAAAVAPPPAPATPDAPGGETGTGNGAAPDTRDVVAPRLTGLTLARTVTRRRGAKLRFTLSEAATVSVTFAQPKTGRTVGTRCRTTTKKNRSKPRCTIPGVRGRLTISGLAGTNTLTFSGKLSKVRRLALGSYRLTATAVDAAGNPASPASRRFTLKR